MTKHTMTNPLLSVAEVLGLFSQHFLTRVIHTLFTGQ
jgi:hypothetical protein